MSLNELCLTALFTSTSEDAAWYETGEDAPEEPEEVQGTWNAKTAKKVRELILTRDWPQKTKVTEEGTTIILCSHCGQEQEEACTIQCACIFAEVRACSDKGKPCPICSVTPSLLPTKDVADSTFNMLYGDAASGLSVSTQPLSPYAKAMLRSQFRLASRGLTGHEPGSFLQLLQENAPPGPFVLSEVTDDLVVMSKPPAMQGCLLEALNDWFADVELPGGLVGPVLESARGFSTFYVGRLAGGVTCKIEDPLLPDQLAITSKNKTETHFFLRRWLFPEDIHTPDVDEPLPGPDQYQMPKFKPLTVEETQTWRRLLTDIFTALGLAKQQKALVEAESAEGSPAENYAAPEQCAVSTDVIQSMIEDSQLPVSTFPLMQSLANSTQLAPITDPEYGPVQRELIGFASHWTESQTNLGFGAPVYQTWWFLNPFAVITDEWTHTAFSLTRDPILFVEERLRTYFLRTLEYKRHVHSVERPLDDDGRQLDSERVPPLYPDGASSVCESSAASSYGTVPTGIVHPTSGGQNLSGRLYLVHPLATHVLLVPGRYTDEFNQNGFPIPQESEFWFCTGDIISIVLQRVIEIAVHFKSSPDAAMKAVSDSLVILSHEGRLFREPIAYLIEYLVSLDSPLKPKEKDGVRYIPLADAFLKKQYAEVARLWLTFLVPSTPARPHNERCDTNLTPPSKEDKKLFTDTEPLVQAWGCLALSYKRLLAHTDLPVEARNSIHTTGLKSHFSKVRRHGAHRATEVSTQIIGEFARSGVLRNATVIEWSEPELRAAIGKGVEPLSCCADVEEMKLHPPQVAAYQAEETGEAAVEKRETLKEIRPSVIGATQRCTQTAFVGAAVSSIVSSVLHGSGSVRTPAALIELSPELLTPTVVTALTNINVLRTVVTTTASSSQFTQQTGHHATFQVQPVLSLVHTAGWDDIFMSLKSTRWLVDPEKQFSTPLLMSFLALVVIFHRSPIAQKVVEARLGFVDADEEIKIQCSSSEGAEAIHNAMANDPLGGESYAYASSILKPSEGYSRILASGGQNPVRQLVRPKLMFTPIVEQASSSARIPLEEDLEGMIAHPVVTRPRRLVQANFMTRSDLALSAPQREYETHLCRKAQATFDTEVRRSKKSFTPDIFDRLKRADALPENLMMSNSLVFSDEKGECLKMLEKELPLIWRVFRYIYECSPELFTQQVQMLAEVWQTARSVGAVLQKLTLVVSAASFPCGLLEEEGENCYGMFLGLLETACKETPYAVKTFECRTGVAEQAYWLLRLTAKKGRLEQAVLTRDEIARVAKLKIRAVAWKVSAIIANSDINANSGAKSTQNLLARQCCQSIGTTDLMYGVIKDDTIYRSRALRLLCNPEFATTVPELKEAYALAYILDVHSITLPPDRFGALPPESSRWTQFLCKPILPQQGNQLKSYPILALAITGLEGDQKPVEPDVAPLVEQYLSGLPEPWRPNPEAGPVRVDAVLWPTTSFLTSYGYSNLAPETFLPESLREFVQQMNKPEVRQAILSNGLLIPAFSLLARKKQRAKALELALLPNAATAKAQDQNPAYISFLKDGLPWYNPSTIPAVSSACELIGNVPWPESSGSRLKGLAACKEVMLETAAPAALAKPKPKPKTQQQGSQGSKGKGKGKKAGRAAATHRVSLPEPPPWIEQPPGLQGFMHGNMRVPPDWNQQVMQIPAYSAQPAGGYQNSRASDDLWNEPSSVPFPFVPLPVDASANPNYADHFEHQHAPWQPPDDDWQGSPYGPWS